MATSSSTDTVIEDQLAEYDDDLDLRLKRVGQLLDIPSIINEPQEYPQIINYCKKTKTQFRLYNWEGYVHFGISYDGKHKRSDLKEQARIVEKYLHEIDAKSVLELAYGMGANTAFLARRNPNVAFDGVDLSHKPLKRYAKIPNAHFQQGDYHDLSAFEDNAYDIAFVVEALCYSTNKSQVLREVKRKLKRDGLFIVIDGYQKDRAAPPSPSEDIALKLVAKGFAVDKFECIKDVESYMQEEYSIVAAQDITQNVLPSLVNAERMSGDYFAHPMFARIVNEILPYEAIKNIMVPYLVPTCLRRQIGCYYIHVLKNDK